MKGKISKKIKSFKYLWETEISADSMHRATMQSVVSYATETMCFTISNEEKMKSIENPIVRRIIGQKKWLERNTWGGAENFLEAGGLDTWNERVWDKNYDQENTEWKLLRDRPRKTQGKWEDKVLEDVTKLEIRNWRDAVDDTEKSNVVEQVTKNT